MAIPEKSSTFAPSKRKTVKNQTVKEGKAVVSGITPKIYRDEVFYAYDFSPFKKDGKLSKNHIHLHEEDIECTVEIYQGTI